MEFKPVLRFGVMSDVHYTEEGDLTCSRFKNAAEGLYNYARGEEYKGVDALYVVGDFADTGTRGQMQRFKEDCDKYILPDTKLVLTLANHELHYGESEQKALEDFADIFGMEVDRHEIIGGFHFISVTTTNDGGEWHDSFDEKKREFLRRELEKAAADGADKPIFVFQHPGVRNTSPGAAFGNVGIDDILSDYPNVIDFAGHSHMAANDPREIHQKNFTVVGTGGIANISRGLWRYKHLSKVGYSVTDFSQMVIVEVDEIGRTLLKVMDCTVQKIFKETKFIDPSLGKAGFTYTDSRKGVKPCFSKGDATLTREGDDVRITFPAAECESEGIWHYNVKFLDGVGKTVREENPVSDHAAYFGKKTYEFVFPNMPSNIERAEIRAVGFFENVSDPIFGRKV